MADDTLTLRLDGEVSLAAFRKAIESFAVPRVPKRR
jgi:hypothetical protein